MASGASRADLAEIDLRNERGPNYVRRARPGAAVDRACLRSAPIAARAQAARNCPPVEDPASVARRSHLAFSARPTPKAHGRACSDAAIRTRARDAAISGNVAARIFSITRAPFRFKSRRSGKAAAVSMAAAARDSGGIEAMRGPRAGIIEPRVKY